MNQAPSASWIDRFSAHPLLISIALFIISLILRLLAIGRYVTPDELIWVYRSVLFREALGAAQWADTLVAGHPGVTTTWLGTIAITLQLLLQPSALEAYNWITQLAYLTPDNMAAYQHLYQFLDAGRTAVALANSLVVVAVYWLTRELLGSRIALAAALLLAVEPFLGGLSGLLHVDGLLASFAIVALLALALGSGLGRQEQSPRRRFMWLILSGIAAGLAVLSKSPGAILLPVVGLTLITLLWRYEAPSLGRRLAAFFGYGIAWLVAFLVTLLLLFPALWSAPQSVLSFTGGNAGRHVAEALRPTFFLGDTSFDHGPIFYPTALLWRLSPLVIGGILLLLIFLVKQRTLSREEKAVTGLLVLWTLLYLITISLTAKKFDRYALPLIPAFVVLAGIALANRQTWNDRLLRALLLALVLAQLLMIVSGMPYLLSTYNPLVGGPFTAQYVLPLGWGESISASGRWLANTPGAGQQTAVSGIAPSLAPFFNGTTLFVETTEWQEADNIILTAGTRQTDPRTVARADAELDLRHTVRFGMLEQGWVYGNPDAHPRTIDVELLAEPLSFGRRMQLLGQDLELEGTEVRYVARWRKEQADPYLIIKLRLLDEAGHTWQTLETELLNEVYFFPRHWAVDETPQVTYRLDLPPAAPPGTYLLELSLVNQSSGGLLPILAGDQAGGVVYAAGSVALDWPAEAIDPARLNMRPLPDANWLNGALQLLGVVDHTTDVQAGGTIDLDLIWRGDDSLPAGLQLAIQLEDGQAAIQPLADFDSANWQGNHILRLKYRLPVADDSSSGTYTVYVNLLDSEGHPLSESPQAVGEVKVLAVDRLFSLPGDIELPLDGRFEPGIYLRGMAPRELRGSSGEALPFTLYWQTEGDTTEPLTAFVHLLDSSGAIVAQEDRWPGGLPSNLWSPNQVIIDEYELNLPADLAPGVYQLAAGLYTASDGVRLPASDASGTRLEDDIFIIPVPVNVEETR